MKNNLFFLTGAIILMGCFAVEPMENENSPSTIEPTTDTVVGEITPESVQPQTIEERNEAVLQALDTDDWTTLATYIHPEKGVRFVPYTRLMESNIIWSAEQLLSHASTDTLFIWGQADGSGLDLEMSFLEYFERFVYSAPYLTPEQIGYNEEIITASNSINNLQEIYPDATFIDHHFSGFDEQYGGMDWKTLRLVYEQVEGEWMLIAIINNQWTI